MIDARTEIDNLRQRLRMKNLSESVINTICDEVSRDISIATSDILASSMDEAVAVGADYRAPDFIEELRAVRTGPTYEITTDSGRTDFSEPPFPMLPRLLKNAKVAQDGSMYKVIPMKQKSTSNNILAVTTEAALTNINNARRIAKEQRDADKENHRGSVAPDAMKGMDTFSAMQQINRSRHIATNNRRQEQTSAAVINFRTASSKQDPSRQWVMPAKHKDLSSPLREINMRMHNEIDSVIQDIIRRYEGMF